MLTRSAVARQVSNALRGNKLSFAALTEEHTFKQAAPTQLTVPSVQNNKLENGLKFTARSRDSGIVNLRFAVLGGSSTESAKQKGAAQFLAASAFTGNNQNSGLRVVRYLESLGATFNATADREKIVYEVSVLADQVDSAVSVVLSSIASPPLYNHVFEEHRPTVQLFYDALREEPTKFLNELVHEAAFGETTGFGSSVYAEDLNNLKVADILAYRGAHFVKENLVVAVDGVSSEEFKKILTAYAGQVPSGSAQAVGEANFVGGEVKVRNSSVGTSHVALAFGIPAGPAGKAYEVLNATLASRLQKKKVCASTFQNKYHNGGFFGLQTRGEASDIDRILRASVDELKAIASDASAAETAKVQVGVNNFSGLDSKNGADALLNAYLAGTDVNAFLDTRAVTAQQVSDAAKAVLKSTPAYAVFGATTGTPSLTTVTKILA
mmetsp:Transcript_5307/g.5807  ORF Transcript_5307/g.5807 Transcript_5307/m.5807 type:complete len:438 (+) Transcript_5307:66-1379(+)|eukprot:CAMPEP_0173148838 /NCGR_PEP_ID=MMETSP1105-20130129/9966_1 /TAXON_ID=2985 /ORGANISM="Ochromonas sp., Strain BG-1" /LENGTH=437 /DNA_ID=CAMNT_0014063585 /DNA_START=57 /DNA_END=1370 /DNA_ORIENTATION=+